VIEGERRYLQPRLPGKRNWVCARTKTGRMKDLREWLREKRNLHRRRGVENRLLFKTEKKRTDKRTMSTAK